MDFRKLQESLKMSLREHGLNDRRVRDVLDSGYFLRTWGDPFSGRTWTTVSDFMYGNKQNSSSFELGKFITYINGVNSFPPLPSFVEYTARSRVDIDEILADDRRTHYIKEGSLSFRGQTRHHTFKRKIPNPVRSDSSGAEISLFPGAYRQKLTDYRFEEVVEETRTLQYLLHKLEPNNPDVFADSFHAYDLMRTEQHYATQTRGLDVSFDIDVAVFFATQRFERTENNKARYTKVLSGNHTGVIYCFRFRDPPVKKTQFLIEEFDLFKTCRPERVLRQHCGLPLIGDFERNIALCDIDCIIHLDKNFDGADAYTARDLFPPVDADPFYAKLLELKDEHPEALGNIVEYEWAR